MDERTNDSKRDRRSSYFAAAITAVAALLLTAIAGAPLLGAGRGPSTPDERQQAVRLTKALEEDPLNKDAKAARRWLLAWLAEIPDISVQMCPALFGKKFESSKEFAGEIAFQQSVSGAAFMIEHPEQSGDKLAVALAGVEGALKGVRVSSPGEAQSPPCLPDALLQARTDGKLSETVARNLKACH